MIAIHSGTRPTTASSTVSLHKPRHRSDLLMIGRNGQEMSLALCRLGAHMGGTYRCAAHNPDGYAVYAARHKAGA